MKTKYLTYSFLLASLLMGCKDELVPETNTPDISNDAEAYFTVKMNLIDEEESQTRDMSFDKGDDWESKIYRFRVYIFKTTSPIKNQADEQAAQYVGYGSYGERELGEGKNDISARGEYKIKASNFLKENLKRDDVGKYYYYGLALANYPSFCFAGNEGTVGIDQQLASQNNFGALYNMKVSTRHNAFFNYNYIKENKEEDHWLSMSNAAYWQSSQSNENTLMDPLILQPIDLNKVVWLLPNQNYEDEVYPEAAANFYIQRNVAKVTLSSESMGKYFTIPAGDFQGKEVEIVGVTPVGISLESYLLQNTSGFTTNYLKKVADAQGMDALGRFHTKGASGFDRVNWSFDPNYEKLSDVGNDNYFNFNNGGIIQYETAGYYAMSWEAKGQSYFYFAENTMDPVAMHRDQTPMLRIVAQLTAPLDPSRDDWGNYKKEVNDPGTIYCYNEIVSIPAKNIVLHQAEFNRIIKEKYENHNPHSWMTNHGVAKSFKDFFADIDDDENDRHYHTDVPAEDIAQIWGLHEDDILYFNGTGRMYYDVPIRHFSDKELNHVLEYDANGHPDYKPEDTGRFGVVRNHCYVISINSINRAGDAYYGFIHDRHDDPDNRESQVPAISYSVNVLDWTMHTDIVDIK